MSKNISDEQFDQLIEQMRATETSPGEMEEARHRVWTNLASLSPACGDFQSHAAAYLAGELPEARRLLLDDHLSHCSHCRRSISSSSNSRHTMEMPPAARRALPQWTGWAAAAAVAAIGIYLGRGSLDQAMAPSGPRARLESGSLTRIGAGALKPGGEVGDGETVRTAAGSRAALRLADGSLVEMNERTELAIHSAWSGNTIRLALGDIIVQAAKQRKGSLRVTTRDSIAAVKGTVFVVSTGTAGSLVSVVEGSVAVSQLGREQLLSAGQQAASTSHLHPPAMRDVVAWSLNATQYFTLLGELIRIEKDIASIIPPTLRTNPSLLSQLPPDTIAYAAIPNLEDTLRQGMAMMDQRAGESQILNQWWNSNSGKEMRAIGASLQQVNALLGEEAVMLLVRRNKDFVPVVLAQPKPGKEQELAAQVARLPGGAPPFLVRPGLFIAAHSKSLLTELESTPGQGAGSAFAREIAARYKRGAGWLFAADMTAGAIRPPDSSISRVFGLNAMRHVFFEQRSRLGSDSNEAMISFQGPRTGVASWLGSPGPAGSAAYISPDSIFAASASMKNPREAFDELLRLGSGMPDTIRKFESETGVSISGELASSLGANFSVSIERLAFPMPGFIAAFEVNDPGAIDNALTKLAAAAPESHTLAISEETSNGRIWKQVRFGQHPPVYWTYDGGYLLVSPDRALAINAITTKSGGTPLIHSSKFKDALPPGTGAHHSGFLWLNTSGPIADLATLIPIPSIRGLLSNREPTVIVFHAGKEQIEASSRTRLTSLLLDSIMMNPRMAPASNWEKIGKAARSSK